MLAHFVAICGGACSGCREVVWREEAVFVVPAEGTEPHLQNFMENWSREARRCPTTDPVAHARVWLALLCGFVLRSQRTTDADTEDAPPSVRSRGEIKCYPAAIEDLKSTAFKMQDARGFEGNGRKGTVQQHWW
ncbi:hypothetical protein TGRUB_249570B [Toxoplasma gondii RUB]|uniref:Uncharacterized protein n=4 Tax=Toxoplasma gondii TaxID=5811 RepID=A0A086M5W6_TOXGO|nr:hypothetical protein TGDOM2_249570B [Toxoplasma gondii GAB2-2007-GAL-DOM2]KFG48836.1 hypothetical protein TGP89_249570B [Toxoplasma gondii p89]KFG54225.1 hypothetical protein TGFOU_249570B [Toxoplasma gondii FOU]KFG64284.1 hypothetical protein TGRUB_249570B [Toxoplasma gondii RUB]